MGKVNRNDSWTPDDDKVLGDNVIATVESGGTQLKAFEKVASILGRTTAAVGFRWNSEVRKQYSAHLEEAKKKAKANKNKAKNTVVALSVDEITQPSIESVNSSPGAASLEANINSAIIQEIPFDIDKIINFLQYVKEYGTTNDQILQEKKQIELQLKKSEQEKKLLLDEIANLKREVISFAEEYEALTSMLKKGKEISKAAKKYETKKTKEAVSV